MAFKLNYAVLLGFSFSLLEKFFATQLFDECN